MTMQSADLAVRKSITVEAPRERAFKVYTERQADWNPPDHQIGEKPFEEIVLEPREGGRWFERDADGNECDWGRVLVYKPPEKVVLAWHLSAEFKYDPDPSQATMLTITFIEEGPTTTRVELEHSGLEVHGDKAEGMRAAIDSPGGWTLTLTRFKEAAEA
jgi:uncharacterized protein YndB with AHSA1/START domain